jgi:hypothetical protein
MCISRNENSEKKVIPANLLRTDSKKKKIKIISINNPYRRFFSETEMKNIYPRIQEKIIRPIKPFSSNTSKY